MSEPKPVDKITVEPLPNDFLPNLCSSQSILLLVLISELVALLLASTSEGLQQLSWDKLALVSFQILWIVLVSAALLCQLRPYLRRWSPLQAGCASYALVLLVTLILSVIGQWILHLFGGPQWQSRVLALDGWMLAGNMVTAAILAGIMLRYLYLQQQLRNQQQAELQARIQALQSRIRPHFLFNSMNSIASLIATDPDTAERLVEDLSELFRASLAEPTLIPLSRELELCKHYLDIEKLRLGERLQIEWQMDSLPPTLEIPGLLLQPLLENAVFHGIEPLPKGGRIVITVKIKGRQVVISITNPVPLALQQSSTTANGATRHNRMARQNIVNRLKAHYGSAARMSNVIDSGTFTTLITYPLEQKKG